MDILDFYNNTNLSNNKKEIQNLKNNQKRSRSDIDFFYLTNESVSYAFKPYVLVD